MAREAICRFGRLTSPGIYNPSIRPQIRAREGASATDIQPRISRAGRPKRGDRESAAWRAPRELGGRGWSVSWIAHVWIHPPKAAKTHQIGNGSPRCPSLLMAAGWPSSLLAWPEATVQASCRDGGHGCMLAHHRGIELTAHLGGSSDRGQPGARERGGDAPVSQAQSVFLIFLA